jgi:hypothetical protein
MQKTSLSFVILTAILVIVFLIYPLAEYGAVEANPYTFAPGLHVYSPTSGLTYIPNVVINFKIYPQNNVTDIDSFSYNLDNNANSPLTFRIRAENHSVNGIVYTVYPITVYKTIEDLPNGVHTIAVYAHNSNGTISSIINSTITIDTTLAIPYTAFVISPLNQTTYNTTQVPLTYTINKEILWSYYRLDSTKSSDLKNFNGNISLLVLSEGLHELTLAVTTKTSPTSQQPYQTIQRIIFFIDPTAPSLTPTLTAPYLPPNNRNAPHLEPTFYLLPISIIVIIIAIALVIFSRRKTFQRITGKGFES